MVAKDGTMTYTILLDGDEEPCSKLTAIMAHKEPIRPLNKEVIPLDDDIISVEAANDVDTSVEAVSRPIEPKGKAFFKWRAKPVTLRSPTRWDNFKSAFFETT